jgi:uncharacterized protein (UPF0332 family)
MTERQDLYQEIHQLIRTAENKLKEAERLDTKLTIPSVNQLRYVAFHLAEALCSRDDASFASEMGKAKNHCYRAIYDSHEMIIIYYLESIKVFREKYAENLSIVHKVLPSLIDYLNSADDAREYISGIDRGAIMSRDEYYRNADPHCKALASISRHFGAAEPVIQSKIREENTKILEKNINENKDARRFIIQVILSTLGVLVAAAAAYFTFLSIQKPSSIVSPATQPAHPKN